MKNRLRLNSLRGKAARVLIVASIGVACAAMVYVDSKPDKLKEKANLKQVISVHGECWEDHVGHREIYSGSIVQWQLPDTKAISTYGFVSLPFSAPRAIEEAQHLTTYYNPDMIEFSEVSIDVSQPKWQIHGVSSRGEDTQGYDSTCDLLVTKRGMELPDALNSSRTKP